MRRDLFTQLCKIHFHDPKNENPIDSLRKLRLFLEYLIVGYEGNYTPEEHLVIEKFYHSGKVAAKHEQYGIKISMLRERKTVYLLNFIIYKGATTTYPYQPDPLPMKFDEYKSPSKIILSLLHDYIHQGYCNTLNNYHIFPELANALFSFDTEFTVKQVLPNQFWDDASKFVSILSTIHTLKWLIQIKLITGTVIKQPDVIMDYNVTMGGIDLVIWVLILYSLQQLRVKWYRKISDLSLNMSVYNSLILQKKVNPDKQNVDHLNYRKLLIKKIIMFHEFDGHSHSTGPNHDTMKASLIRVTERHFISQLPSTNNKTRAQNNVFAAQNLAFAKTYLCGLPRVI